jgi:hypothetical protein
MFRDQAQKIFLTIVAHDQFHVGQPGDCFTLQGGVAAGDDQAGGRVGAGELAGKLAALAGGLAGDRATVEHAEIGLGGRAGQLMPRAGQSAAQAGHLCVVQAAA